MVDELQKNDEEYEYVELKEGEELPEGVEYEYIEVPADGAESQPKINENTKDVEDILQDLEKEVLKSPEESKPIPLTSEELLAMSKPKDEVSLVEEHEGENFEDFSGDANDEVFINRELEEPSAETEISLDEFAEPIYMEEEPAEVIHEFHEEGGESESEKDVIEETLSKTLPGLENARVFNKALKVDFFDGKNTASIEIKEASVKGYNLIIFSKKIMPPAGEETVVSLDEDSVRYVNSNVDDFQTVSIEGNAGNTLSFASPISGIIVGDGAVLYFARVKEIIVH